MCLQPLHCSGQNSYQNSPKNESLQNSKKFPKWQKYDLTSFFKINKVLCTLENLFFPKLRKKFAAPPKSITNDVYFTVLEGNIHFMSNKLVRAHFHFYIIYKLKNEMVHIINCLDSSVGRAIGSDPEG